MVDVTGGGRCGNCAAKGLGALSRADARQGSPGSRQAARDAARNRGTWLRLAWYFEFGVAIALTGRPRVSDVMFLKTGI